MQGPVGQPQATGLVGEDAHDVGAAFKLLVEPFEQVGRLEVAGRCLKAGEQVADLTED